MAKMDTWKRQGKLNFAGGRYEEAIKCLNRVLQKEPEDLEAWIFKGRSLYYLKKYVDSIKCYDKATELSPNNQETWQEKLNCLEKLAIASPKNADIWDQKTEALMNLGRFEEALEISEKYPGLCPKSSPRLWIWKADTLLEQGRCDDALDYCHKIIKYESMNEDAWLIKGRSLHLQNKNAESLKCYDRAIEINEKSGGAWAEKSEVLRSLFRYKEAEEALAIARKLGHASPHS